MSTTAEAPSDGGPGRGRRFPLAAAMATVAGLGTGWWLRHASAPAVRAWSPGAGVRARTGSLSVRSFGSGEAGVVLLHGIVSSGDQFGSAFDALGRDSRVVCPDLLGFGASMDDPDGDFSLGAHLRALGGAIEASGLGQARLTIAGHSLGGTLALHLAAARREQVERVVIFNAPLHWTTAATRRRIGELGVYERLFALDSHWSEAACRWMCRHRTLAAWIASVCRPSLPVPLTRGSVRHTWSAYRGAMDEVLLHPG